MVDMDLVGRMSSEYLARMGFRIKHAGKGHIAICGGWVFIEVEPVPEITAAGKDVHSLVVRGGWGIAGGSVQHDLNVKPQ